MHAVAPDTGRAILEKLKERIDSLRDAKVAYGEDGRLPDLIVGISEGGVDAGTPVPTLIASEVLAGITSDQWAAATRITVTQREMGGGVYAFEPADLSLRTRAETTCTTDSRSGPSFRDAPACGDHVDPDRVLTAGEPYIITITNPSTNTDKHYWTAPEFFQSIAARKAQTSDAEYKMPYLDAVKLLIGGSIDLYIVPVVPGTYDIQCTIPGHADGGMRGTITVTGPPANIDLEVDPMFDTALATDARRSGSHAVWTSPTRLMFEMQELGGGAYAYSTANLTMAVDVGHILQFSNPSTNSEKHYFTAPEFYRTLVTRKAQDTQAEIKVPYFRAVELLIGGSTELFIVPTVAATYDSQCTIPGHAAGGMMGTIIVTP